MNSITRGVTYCWYGTYYSWLTEGIQGAPFQQLLRPVASRGPYYTHWPAAPLSVQYTYCTGRTGIESESCRKVMGASQAAATSVGRAGVGDKTDRDIEYIIFLNPAISFAVLMDVVLMDSKTIRWPRCYSDQGYMMRQSVNECTESVKKFPEPWALAHQEP